MFFIVLGAETVLAASVEKTLMEYGQFVPPDSRAASEAWQFGQIIPFFMLLQPILEALRAILPKIVFKHKARKARKQQARGDLTIETRIEDEEEKKERKKITEAEIVMHKN